MPPSTCSVRNLLASLAVAAVLVPGAGLAQESEATFDALRSAIFGERSIGDGSGLIELVAPKRAEDAALVPLEIRIHAPDGQAAVKSVTLVIDENPAPVAATIKLGEAQRAFDLSTRVRVNSYSFVRAVAETTDGALHMVKSYVKAAGGCSAPASKDPAEAKARIGEMRFRAFSDLGRQEAQTQIRHPSYSGLQMDQVTRLYTPAWFISDLKVEQGDRLLFSVEGGISISEDPSFRFSYRPTAEPVTIEAKDTEGRVFRKSFPGGQGS
jgi:sulfur-oxidizing protein SoxY